MTNTTVHVYVHIIYGNEWFAWDILHLHKISILFLLRWHGISVSIDVVIETYNIESQ